MIGGLAGSARGFPRSTQDVDFLVDIDDARCAELALLINAHYDAPDLGDPLSGGFAFEPASEFSRVGVQAIRLGPKLTAAALSDVSHVQIGNASVPIVGLRGLTLLKLYAGGGQVLLDAKTLIEVNAPPPAEIEAGELLVAPFGLEKQFRLALD